VRLSRLSFAATRLAFFAVATLIGVAAAGKPAEVFVGADAKWHRYQSPHFELYSHNGDAESREFLHSLELLQAVFTERFHFVPKARLDVTAFYFETTDDFRAYLPASMAKSEAVGFYLAGLDRATICAAPADDSEAARHVVFHEFIHHLFRAAGENPPPWFNEGTAELLASLKQNGDKVEIGWPEVGRLRPVRTEKLLPLETLFSVDQESPIYRANDHTGLFYAESWALLHYWYFGDSTKITKDAVSRFLAVASRPEAVAQVDLRAYFHECFGVDYADMQRQLERYVETGRFRVGILPAPPLPDRSTYAERAVPVEEIRLRLAELALRTQRSPAGKLALLNAGQAGEARALEVLGTDAVADHDEAAARAHWEAAISAGSHNVAVFRELGLMESAQWFKEFNYDFRLADDVAQRLRERLRKSIDYEPQQAAAYEMLAWVEAYSPTPVIANIAIVQRQFPHLINKQSTVVALGMARVHLGKPDEAKAILAQLAKLPPDPWSAYAAEIIRAKLEGRSIASIHPRTGREIVEEAVATQHSALRYPSVELPDTL